MPTVTGMIRRLALVALPLALLAGALSACTESTRIPPAEPTAEVAPLFATDEEALEAATAAYEEYLVASSAASSDPVSEPVNVIPLVTEQYLEEFKASLAQLNQEGLRTSGSIRLASASLQQQFRDASSTTVIAYVCLDVSGARVVADDGSDRTPSERDTSVGLEVVFVTTATTGRTLLIDSSQAWAGGEQCAAS